MKITIVATMMIFVAYFLILYAGVAWIQDKRFFSSAPKENFEAILDKKERFRGAHIIGWIIGIFAMLLFAAAIVLAAWDGIRNEFSFLKFFDCFLVMLYAMEIYDIAFFDWVLLSHGVSQIILNIEAQKEDPSGYDILNRAIYYTSRMVSSQKGCEFEGSNYNDIKRVYSI